MIRPKGQVTIYREIAEQVILGSGCIDPSKVDGGVALAMVGEAFAEASGDAQEVEEVKDVESGPGFKVVSPAGAGNAGGRPGWGEGVEVANVEGRGERVEFEIEDCLAACWVFDVVVDIGDEEMVIPDKDFQDEEGGVGN